MRTKAVVFLLPITLVVLIASAQEKDLLSKDYRRAAGKAHSATSDYYIAIETYESSEENTDKLIVERRKEKAGDALDVAEGLAKTDADKCLQEALEKYVSKTERFDSAVRTYVQIKKINWRTADHESTLKAGREAHRANMEVYDIFQAAYVGGLHKSCSAETK